MCLKTERKNSWVKESEIFTNFVGNIIDNGQFDTMDHARGGFSRN